MSKTSSFNKFEKGEKLQMVEESELPGMSVSYVARTSSPILKKKTLQGPSVYIKL